MTRTSVTKDQIFEAARTLTAEGRAPSTVSVRDRVGGGSYTTIQKYLEEWRRAEGATALKHDGPPPPSPADEAMTAAVRELWRLASEAASAEAERVKEEAAAKVREAEGRLKEAEAEVERLERALHEKEAEASRLATVVQDMGRAESANIAREDELRDRLFHLEHRLKEDNKRIGVLEEALEAKQRSLQSLTGSLSKAEAQIEYITKERDDERRAKDQAAATLAAVTQAKGEVERLVDALRTEHQALGRQEATAVAQVAELRERLKAEALRSEGLDKRVSALVSELAKLAAAGGR